MDIVCTTPAFGEGRNFLRCGATIPNRQLLRNRGIYFAERADARVLPQWL